jgi:hypothetical protein
MNDSPHCALSACGALKFAEDKNFPICHPEELISEYAIKIGRSSFHEYANYHYQGTPVQEDEDYQYEDQQFEDQQFEDQPFVDYALENFGEIPQTHDTVSAVALDIHGHLACATSTGTNCIVYNLSETFMHTPCVGLLWIHLV